MGMNISAERAAIYRSNTLGEKAPIYFLAKRMFVRYPSLPCPPPRAKFSIRSSTYGSKTPLPCLFSTCVASSNSRCLLQELGRIDRP